MTVDWQRQPDGITLRIWAQPGASKNAVAGIQGNALKIQLRARPVEGAANTALIAFLAALFGVRRPNVTIRQGEQQRQKLVAITGDTEALARRLEAIAPSSA